MYHYQDRNFSLLSSTQEVFVEHHANYISRCFYDDPIKQLGTQLCSSVPQEHIPVRERGQISRLLRKILFHAWTAGKIHYQEVCQS